MKKFTGEKARSLISPIKGSKVFQGKHYYKGKRCRFTLATFKKTGAKFEDQPDGSYKMVEPTGKKADKLYRQLRKIYAKKVVEIEKKHDRKEVEAEHTNNKQISIKEAMDHWLLNSEANRDPQTVDKFYRPAVKRYLSANGNHTLRDMSSAHINAFKEHLKINIKYQNNPDNEQPTTTCAYRNIHLKQIRRFINWVKENKDYQGQQYLVEAPKIELFEVVNTLPELYSEDEMACLINYLSSRLMMTSQKTNTPQKRKPNSQQRRYVQLHQRFLILTLGTGLRRGEAAFLEWNQIDFETGIITLRSKLKYGFSIKKRESMRLILPFALECLKKERENTQDEAFILDDGKGEPAYKDPHAVTTAFLRYRKELGLNPKADSVHSIRAFFVSLAEHAGVNPFTIQQMLGHKSSETTRIYLGRRSEKIRKAIEEMVIGTERFVLSKDTAEN